MLRVHRPLALLVTLSLLLAGCSAQPAQPVAEPVTEPEVVAEPVAEVVAEPTAEPTAEPEPVSEPTAEPVAEPEAVAEEPALTEEELAAVAVVEAMDAFYAEHPLSFSNLKEYMLFYAEDAVMTILTSSYSNEVYTGNEAIRRSFQSGDAASGASTKFTILGVDGNTVVTHVLTTDTSLAPYELEAWDGLEVFVIEDGLVQQDTWAMAPDFFELFLERLAQAGGTDYRNTMGQDTLNVVTSAMAPAALAPMTAESSEEMLKYYADDIVYTVLGLPGGTQVYQGKDSLAGLFAEWVAAGTRREFEPLGGVSDEINGRSMVWNDEFAALGVAPVKAANEVEVRDGLIVKESWIISPDSLEALVAASQ